MENYILCCDWGTSIFRLQLINIADYQLVGEIISSDGIAGIFDAWKTTGQNSMPERNRFFRRHIKKQIDALSEKLSADLGNVAILISGMASSSIGMNEVPYAVLPFALDGSEASVKHFAPSAEFPHEMMLISGVRSDQDVMRGEETQLIGILELLDKAGRMIDNAVFVFPGTHSKHIYIQNGQIVEFETCMTGEIFSLMANYSILKESVQATETAEFSQNDRDAFIDGLAVSDSSNILFSLFSVRANQLFGKLDKRENFFYLSGLLIGTELKHLINKAPAQLVLCSGSNLFEYYKLAIDELQLPGNAITIPAELVDRAAFVGQIRIFRNKKMQLKEVPE